MGLNDINTGPKDKKPKWTVKPFDFNSVRKVNTVETPTVKQPENKAPQVEEPRTGNVPVTTPPTDQPATGFFDQKRPNRYGFETEKQDKTTAPVYNYKQLEDKPILKKQYQERRNDPKNTQPTYPLSTPEISEDGVISSKDISPELQLQEQTAKKEILDKINNGEITLPPFMQSLPADQQLAYVGATYQNNPLITGISTVISPLLHVDNLIRSGLNKVFDTDYKPLQPANYVPEDTSDKLVNYGVNLIAGLIPLGVSIKGVSLLTQGIKSPFIRSMLTTGLGFVVNSQPEYLDNLAQGKISLQDYAISTAKDFGTGISFGLMPATTPYKYAIAYQSVVPTLVPVVTDLIQGKEVNTEEIMHSLVSNAILSGIMHKEIPKETKVNELTGQILRDINKYDISQQTAEVVNKIINGYLLPPHQEPNTRTVPKINKGKDYDPIIYEPYIEEVTQPEETSTIQVNPKGEATVIQQKAPEEVIFSNRDLLAEKKIGMTEQDVAEARRNIDKPVFPTDRSGQKPVTEPTPVTQRKTIELSEQDFSSKMIIDSQGNKFIVAPDKNYTGRGVKYNVYKRPAGTTDTVKVDSAMNENSANLVLKNAAIGDMTIIDRTAVKPKAPEIKTTEPAAPQQPKGIRTFKQHLAETPRSELPKEISEKIREDAEEKKQWVNDMKIERYGSVVSQDPVTGESKGTSPFTINTFPKWFSDLQIGKKELLNALDKIIEDKGKDKGVTVERVKELIIRHLEKGISSDELQTSNTIGGIKRTSKGDPKPHDEEVKEFLDQYGDVETDYAGFKKIIDNAPEANMKEVSNFFQEQAKKNEFKTPDKKPLLNPPARKEVAPETKTTEPETKPKIEDLYTKPLEETPKKKELWEKLDAGEITLREYKKEIRDAKKLRHEQKLKEKQSIKEPIPETKQVVVEAQPEAYEEAKGIIKKALTSGRMDFMGLSKLGDLADPKVLKAVYDVAKYHTGKFVEWSKKVIADVGNWIKPHLKNLWNEITKDRTGLDNVVTHGFQIKGKDDNIDPIIDKVKSGEILERILNKSLTEEDFNKIKNLEDNTQYKLPELFKKYDEYLKEKHNIDVNKSQLARAEVLKKDNISLKNIELGDKLYYDKNTNTIINSGGETIWEDKEKRNGQIGNIFDDFKNIPDNVNLIAKYQSGSGKTLTLESEKPQGEYIYKNEILRAKDNIERINKYFDNIKDNDLISQHSNIVKDVVNPYLNKIKRKQREKQAEIETGISQKELRAIKKQNKLTESESKFYDWIDKNNIPKSIQEFENSGKATNEKDVTVNDVILFTEPYYSGSYKNPKYEGDRKILGVITKESYGDQKGQHTFTIHVLDSDSIDIANGEIIRRKGRNIYKDMSMIRMATEEDLANKHSRGEQAKERKYLNWLKESKNGDVRKLDKIPQWFIDKLNATNQSNVNKMPLSAEPDKSVKANHNLETVTPDKSGTESKVKSLEQNNSDFEQVNTNVRNTENKYKEDLNIDNSKKIIKSALSKDSGISFGGLSKLGDITDPKVLKAVYDVAKYHLENGAVKLADWSRRMVKELGDWIKPHLKNLWNEITKDRTGLKNVVTQGLSFGKKLVLDIREVKGRPETFEEYKARVKKSLGKEPDIEVYRDAGRTYNRQPDRTGEIPIEDKTTKPQQTATPERSFQEMRSRAGARRKKLADANNDYMQKVYTDMDTIKKEMEERGYKGQALINQTEIETINRVFNSDPAFKKFKAEQKKAIVREIKNKFKEEYKKGTAATAILGEEYQDKNLWNRIKNSSFLQSLTHIERQGPSGKEIADRFRQMADDERKWTGEPAGLLLDIQALSKEDHSNLRDIWEAKMNEQIPPNYINERVQELDNKINDYFTNIAGEFKDRAFLTRNVLTGDIYAFTPRKDYRPRILNDKIRELDIKTDKQGSAKQNPAREKVIDFLLQTSQAKDRAAAAILLDNELTKHRIRKAGNVEYSRLQEVRLPDDFYETDPGISLMRYGDKAAKRLAFVDAWGMNGQIFQRLRDDLYKQGKDYQRAHDLFRYETGQLTAKERKAIEDVNNIKALQALTKFTPFTSLRNSLQGFLGTTIKGNLKAAMTGLVKSLDPELKRSAYEAGAMAENLGGILKEAAVGGEGNYLSKLTGKYLDLIQFTSTDRYNRVISAIGGLSFMEDMLKRIKTDSRWKGRAKREFEAMKIDPDEVIKSGGFTKEQKDLIMRTFSFDTQFSMRPSSLPLWWSSPHGKLVTQWKPWGYKMTQLLRDSVLREIKHGNVVPLITMAAAFGIGGETVNFIIDSLRSVANFNPMNDKQETPVEKSLIYKAANGDIEGFTRRFVNDIAGLGALSIYYDIVRSFGYGKTGKGISTFLGPAISEAVDVINNVFLPGAQQISGTTKDTWKETGKKTLQGTFKSAAANIPGAGLFRTFGITKAAEDKIFKKNGPNFKEDSIIGKYYDSLPEDGKEEIKTIKAAEKDLRDLKERIIDSPADEDLKVQYQNKKTELKKIKDQSKVWYNYTQIKGSAQDTTEELLKPKTGQQNSNSIPGLDKITGKKYTPFKKKQNPGINYNKTKSRIDEILKNVQRAPRIDFNKLRKYN